MANSILMRQSQSSKFIWAIENFSSLNDKECHYSDDFMAGGCKWSILIYPKGLLVGKFGVYLVPESLGNKTIYAEYSLAIFNQKNQKETVTRDRKHMFSSQTWGSPIMMSLSDLHDPDKGFVVDDTCVLQAKILVGWPNDIKVSPSTQIVNSETVVYPNAGKPFEEDQEVVLCDENHEIVGGFSVLRRHASLYRRIWLKYGHIASTIDLPGPSYTSLVTLVADIMNTIVDMYRCHYLDVSAELIGTWECKIRLARKLEFKVRWLRDRFNDVKKDYDSGLIKKLQKEAKEKEGPIPLVVVKNEPSDDIQESLPGFLFEGML